MQLFRIKAGLAGTGSLSEFLEHHYISFEAPGIGDLSQFGVDEIRKRLSDAPESDEKEREQELERRAKEFDLFAHVMQDGDYVIADDGERLALGDLGDYYYLAEFDNAEDRSGHRRGVTWLRSLQREELHPELLAFVAGDGAVGQFGRPVAVEELERLLSRPAASGCAELIDEATIREALDILKAAMRSEDPERRERAAIAILQSAGRV